MHDDERHVVASARIQCGFEQHIRRLFRRILAQRIAHLAVIHQAVQTVGAGKPQVALAALLHHHVHRQSRG